MRGAWSGQKSLKALSDSLFPERGDIELQADSPRLIAPLPSRWPPHRLILPVAFAMLVPMIILLCMEKRGWQVALTTHLLMGFSRQNQKTLYKPTDFIFEEGQ